MRKPRHREVKELSYMHTKDYSWDLILASQKQQWRLLARGSQIWSRTRIPWKAGRNLHFWDLSVVLLWQVQELEDKAMYAM